MRAFGDAAIAVLGSVALGVALTRFYGESTMSSWASLGACVIFVAAVALSVALRRPAFSTPADRVTLLRAVLAGGCTTLVVLSVFADVPSRSWILFALATPALLLDAVDGWVARKTGTANPHGARLDMETDAAFLAVLSIPVAFFVGPWALAIGAMRYVFVAASWWRPALRQKLNYSSFRRITAGFQGVTLVFVLMPIVPFAVAVPITAVALVLLIVSFGKDILTLESSFKEARVMVDQP